MRNRVGAAYLLGELRFQAAVEQRCTGRDSQKRRQSCSVWQLHYPMEQLARNLGVLRDLYLLVGEQGVMPSSKKAVALFLQRF